MELISVIVPVYNVEHYLLRCVASIQKQTYKNLEIILVDDGSPDNCPQMCDRLADEDPRIKVIHKENGGLGFARNSGLDVVTGEYVTFIDSDDWISENHIENLFQALTENSADAVIGSHTSINTDGVETLHPILLKEGVYEGEAILYSIILPLIGPAVGYPSDVQVNASSCMNLYKMELIRTNNIRFISEKYAVGEDLYFNIDFFHFSRKLVAINENGYYYYENDASISRKYNPKRFERSINFYDKLHEQVAEYDLDGEVSYRIERSFLMKIRVAIRLIVTSDLHRKEKIQEIKTIIKHELVKQVLNDYPIHTFVPSMRLFTKLMRAENAVGVYYMMKIREASKRQRLLKSVLKRIGIGK